MSSEEQPNKPPGALRATKASVLAHLIHTAETATNEKNRILALSEVAKIKGMVTKKSEISMTVRGSVMLVPFCESPEQWSALATAHDKRLRDEVKAAPLPVANDETKTPYAPAYKDPI